MKKFNSFLAVLLSLTMVLSFAFVSSAVVFAGAPTPNADKLVKYLNAQDNKLYFSTKYNPADVDEALIKEALTKLIERGTPEQIADLNGNVEVSGAVNVPGSDDWTVTLKESSNGEEVNLTLAVSVKNVVENFHAAYVPGGSFTTANDLAEWGMYTFGSSVIAGKLRDHFSWVKPDPNCNGLLVAYYDVPSYGEYETYVNFNSPAGAGVTTVLAAGQTAEDIALGGDVVKWAKTDSGMLCEKWLHKISSPYLGAYMIYFVGADAGADLESVTGPFDLKVEGEANYTAYSILSIDSGGGSPGVGVIGQVADDTDAQKPDSNKPSPEEPTLSDGVFSDTAMHWAKIPISLVVEKGLFKGVGDGKFDPDSMMTRGSFVTVLGRMAKANTADFTEGKFEDVQQSAYYAPYVDWAVKNGIVKGMSEKTFAPNSAVTREQMAVMIYAYLKANNKVLPEKNTEVNFADASKISGYAADAVKAMCKADLLKGRDGNVFDPSAAVTRAEAATIFSRLLDLEAPVKAL